MSSPFTPLVRLVILLAVPHSGVRAETTIAPGLADSQAYGANIGWINWRGDVAGGATIGEFVCAGFIHSANCGWIHLGSGAPADGVRYGNLTAGDFGVNTRDHGSDGVLWEAKLRGFAYGANIGWVSFEETGDPRVDLISGRLLGHVYGANVGWISLSEIESTVTTTSIHPGADEDGDGIPDAWEKSFTGSLLAMDKTTDTDMDGAGDLEEYGAGTSPVDAGDKLRITIFAPTEVDAPFLTELTWTSKPTRRYEIEASATLDHPWFAVAKDILPSGGVTTFLNFPDPEILVRPDRRFYRVVSKLPLAP